MNVTLGGLKVLLLHAATIIMKLIMIGYFLFIIDIVVAFK